MDYTQLMPVHIIGGAVGLVSGFAALVFRKGSRAHRMAGNVFFISMLTMSGTGAFIAYFKPAAASVIAGSLTFYMVATGWATVMRSEKTTGFFEIGALLVGIAVASLALFWGFEAANSDNGVKDGFPAGIYYAFGSVAALAALLDLSAIMRGGVAGVQRIARHLWRMCYALFMAAASFFLGQSQIIPEPLREIQFLATPVLAVIILMFFWLIRVLFTGWGKAA